MTITLRSFLTLTLFIASSASAQLNNGDKFPDLAGLKKIDGTEVAISEVIKGKIAVIDFWATWCPPCRAEIPFEVKLMKEFKNRDDVVFVFVSIDTNSSNWIAKVNDKDKGFNGEGQHLNSSGDWYSPASTLYRLDDSGIPRIMIINKEGKIVNNAAPRPSDGDELATAIENAKEPAEEVEIDEE